MLILVKSSNQRLSSLSIRLHTSTNMNDSVSLCLCYNNFYNNTSNPSPSTNSILPRRRMVARTRRTSMYGIPRIPKVPFQTPNRAASSASSVRVSPQLRYLNISKKLCEIYFTCCAVLFRENVLLPGMLRMPHTSWKYISTDMNLHGDPRVYRLKLRAVRINLNMTQRCFPEFYISWYSVYFLSKVTQKGYDFNDDCIELLSCLILTN